jgi:hypothetical protein
VSKNIHRLIEQHHAFYEVLPYYIVQEQRTHGTTKKIRLDLISTCTAPSPVTSDTQAGIMYSATWN